MIMVKIRSQQSHNMPELKAAKFAIMALPKTSLTAKLTHLSKGKAALRYIVKIKGILQKSPLELPRLSYVEEDEQYWGISYWGFRSIRRISVQQRL